MYDPQDGALDFEIGAFGDRFKKAMKKVGKGIGKFTDYTIVKPSAAIGGMVGGKRGREWGRKLGKLTQKVTHFGLAAGAAPIVASSPTLLTATAAGMLGKRLKKKLSKKKKSHHRAFDGHIKRRIKSKKSHKPVNCDNAAAADVAARLVKVLGGPLSEANKRLKLAELQRKATAEHGRLMSDAEFRRKVLTGITELAAGGNQACERTIRVIMGR